MKKRMVPEGTETIRTYEELNKLVSGFREGHYQFLFLVGRPGLGKSYDFEQQLGENGYIIKGWSAPLQAYIDAYTHRNRPLVFDDAEVLWKRPGGRILLRSLTEHRARKTAQWRSTANELIKLGVPKSFQTTSKVAIIANRFSFGTDEECDAILDRGHLVLFDPLPSEIHDRVGDWFWDQAVYDFIGKHIHLLDCLSARTYLKAYERKQAGGNWRKLIKQVYCHKNSSQLVQSLESNLKFRSVDEKVEEFKRKTGLSRAQYYILKRELRRDQQLTSTQKVIVPRRLLRSTPPNTEDLLGIDGILELPGNQNIDESERSRNSGRPEPNTDAPQSITICSHEMNLVWLQKEMGKAIEQENYEYAAELRDLIQKQADEESED